MGKDIFRSFRTKPGEGHLFILLVVLIYTIIIVKSVNCCYFWDNVQQTSKEAYWYYDNNFSSFLPPGFSEGSEIVGTGCHPPLMGIMTAFLWKIFGKYLWVSHIFIAFWAFCLVYNTFRLLKHLVQMEIVCYLLPVLLLDSTILSQISIASPDIILLASLILSIRAVLENRRFLLTVSSIFLVLINGRGAVTGGIFFIFYIIYQKAVERKNISAGMIFNSLIPFLPAFLLAGFYYIYYIINNGWFFNNPDSPWAGAGQRPEGFLGILKNIAAFCLRLGENGRFIIYIMGIVALTVLIKRRKLKATMSGLNLSLAWLFFLLLMFFLYFVVTTTSAMTSRYYMGMFFVFNILIFRLLPGIISINKIKIISVVAVVFLLTGNLWMYPDKISKAWDATLAHMPYYELRAECLDYLENNNFDFTRVSGGFCFKGNQKYIDLNDRDLNISEGTDNQFFIYSNISNPDDSLINELTYSGKWNRIKTFRKGFVFVSIYENRYFIDSGK
jgi:hypothetical protein